MEKLLTIKEAAFLKVSEMSLRRWTNSGKLKCYRVGGKNERRFTRQDLEGVLRTSERLVPLGIGDTTVEDCSHIAHFYKDSDECITEGIKYLSCGLSQGESLLILSTDARLIQILSGLNNLGFPVDKLKNDKLIILDSGRSHFDEQLKFLTSAIPNFRFLQRHQFSRFVFFCVRNHPSAATEYAKGSFIYFSTKERRL